MKILIIVAVVLLLLFLYYLYACKFIFYKEKEVKILPHEEDCFSPLAKSIIVDNHNDKAILFIHGFSATPYMYIWASEVLSNKGYDTYAPLIPGHGVSIEEYLKTNYTTWFNYIDEYYLSLRKKYKTLHVVGTSMGGAMALELGEKYCNTQYEMSSITTIAAPIVYNSLLRDGIVTEPLGYICRLGMHFIPSIKAEVRTYRPDHNDGDEVWVGFGGVYPRQGISFMSRLPKIRKNLNKITCPLLSVHCTSDKTVPYKNLKIIEKEVGTKNKTIKTIEMDKDKKHSHHVLLHYNSSREEVMSYLYPFLEENNE